MELRLINRCVQSFIALLCPPLCLHCQSSLELSSRHFCAVCLSLMDFIDVHKRCPRCFSPDACQKKKLCRQCSQSQDFPLTQMGAAFEHIGPAATLVQKMKYGGLPYLAKGAAAFLAMQFFSLGWPMPDCIVPVPISSLRFLQRGYNQSLEIALELSTYINRPVLNVLKRKNGGFSQAGLPYKERVALECSAFSLRKSAKLHDKIILLIDDVTTTGSTLQRCAGALQEHCPQAIYALTFTKA